MTENIANVRLINELSALIQDTPEGITIMYDIMDMFHWNCYMLGPTGTPYEGLSYELRIRFRKDYPFTPPVIRFITPIFHPNVKPNGILYLSVLDHDWTPAMIMEKLLLLIRSTLGKPETGASIVNPDAYELFQHDKDVYCGYVQRRYNGEA